MKLRGNNPIIPDKDNNNKYCIISNDNSHKTAYCFSVPVYGHHNCELLKLRFEKTNDLWFLNGSSGRIEISDILTIKNNNEEFMIQFPEDITYASNHSIHFGKTEVKPTTNGVLVKKECKNNSCAQIKLTMSTPCLPYWANRGCFCFMNSNSEPCLCLSCIGASSDSTQISNPINMWYTKVSDCEYIFEFLSTDPSDQYVLFEMNIYENKLFQDTTVESANPLMNNAYGTTAYIGTTPLFGEQWLYFRIDNTLILEFYNRKIEKAIIHFPKLNRYVDGVKVYTVSNHFCGFGTNWNNKVPIGVQVSSSQENDRYYSVDISNQTIDPNTKYIRKTNGFVLKPKSNNGVSVLATGDSYFAPPILEICYR